MVAAVSLVVGSNGATIQTRHNAVGRDVLSIDCNDMACSIAMHCAEGHRIGAVISFSAAASSAMTWTVMKSQVCACCLPLNGSLVPQGPIRLAIGQLWTYGTAGDESA